MRVNKVYLVNAFSLGMLRSYLDDVEGFCHILVKRASVEEVCRFLKDAEESGVPVVSAVGHASTAQVLSRLLNREVPVNRVTIDIKPGECPVAIVVFQLLERLPEGKVLTEQELQQLVESGKAQFYIVIVP